MAPDRITAPALRRGLDILELLTEEQDGLRVPEITQHLGFPRATTHELVNTLADRGYVTVDKETGRIHLGVKVLRLGAGYERSIDLAQLGREAASEVATQCGETVQMVVRDGTFVIFIVKVDSNHSVRLVSQVGSRLPITCTAGGKVLLSSLRDTEIEQMFPNDDALVPMTSNSIDSLERLHRELKLTRERGWAEEHSESNQHVNCVSAPVFDRLGNCVAAMSISVPVVRWTDADRNRFVELLKQGTQKLTVQLGGKPSAQAAG